MRTLEIKAKCIVNMGFGFLPKINDIQFFRFGNIPDELPLKKAVLLCLPNFLSNGEMCYEVLEYKFV